MSGAVVTLTDADRSVVTGTDGRYRLEATDAGPQHLSVKRIGYADVPMPYAKDMELAAMPDGTKVATAAREVLNR